MGGEAGDELTTDPGTRDRRRQATRGALLAALGLAFAAAVGWALAALARVLRPTLGAPAELVLLLAPAGLAPAISGLAMVIRAVLGPRTREPAVHAAPWPPGAPPSTELDLVSRAAARERLPEGCFVILDPDQALVALLTPSGAWRRHGDTLEGMPWADVSEVVVDGAGVRLLAAAGPPIAWRRIELGIEAERFGGACHRWRAEEGKSGGGKSG